MTVKRIIEFTDSCATQYKGHALALLISVYNKDSLNSISSRHPMVKMCAMGWEPCWRITAIRLWSVGKLYLALPLMSTIMQLHICLSLLNWQKNLEVQESWSCQHETIHLHRGRKCEPWWQEFGCSDTAGHTEASCHQKHWTTLQSMYTKPILLLCSLWRQSWRCLLQQRICWGMGKLPADINLLYPFQHLFNCGKI